MRKLFSFATIIFITGISALNAQSNLWVTAYYAGWNQGRYNNGVLPSDEIDISAVTHIIHFAILPRADGTLDTTVNNIVESNSAAILSKAKAAGPEKKVIISIGGWGSADAFRGATSLLNRSAFINRLIAFMKNRGYDGIDIDWEPLEGADILQFTLFITELRLRIDAMSPRPLLTAAVNSQAAAFASLINNFDQINVMTYDLSGAWPGWVTWHNAPLYNGGSKFPSTGGPLPAASDIIDQFIAAGIPASKLGLGIDFYGYVWSGGNGTPTGGVTAPQQSWTSAPSVRANVSYADIMAQYYQPSAQRWDDVAQTSYLSIDNSGSADDKFISFEDENSIWQKFEYARSKGLGGVFVWELGGGHRTDLPSGQQDALLQYVKKASNGVEPPPQPSDLVAPTVAMTSPAGGATISGIIELSATATDNIGVVGVQFKLDGQNVGSEDNSNPYSVSLNSAQTANGTHTITVTARDAAGNKTSAAISVTVQNGNVDTIAPTVAFTSPASGATITGTMTVSVSASDNFGVVGVQFKLDGNDLGNEDRSAPYSASVNTAQLANGPHTLSATARDSAGNTTIATISVTVQNGGADTIAPTVSFASPSDGATISGAVTVRANASDNVGIVGVQFTLDGNTLGSEDTSQPYTRSLNSAQVANGTYTLVATARDAAGNKTTATITITVSNIGTDAAPPSVSIASPTAGASVSGIVTVIATASDNVAVASVQFQLDGNNVGSPRTAAPYQFSWNTMTASDGIHTVSAVAKDSAGNEASSSVSVTVQNVPSLAAPSLLSPTNSAMSVEIAPIVRWNPLQGANAYDVQVSTTANFSSSVVEQYGLSANLLILGALSPNTTYFWRVRASNTNSGAISPYSDAWRFTTGSVTAVGDLPGGIPTELVLLQNYPNPFNPETHITVALPEEASARLTVLDVLGREVVTLAQGILQPGYHSVRWDGRDESGKVVGNGMYLYRVEAVGLSGKNFSQTKKMLFMK